MALPPFRPSVSADDVNLAAGVGENQPNRWRDVWNVQKGLSNTGHYPLDLTQEKSGEHSPTLAQAIRNFQREKREEIDGTLLPGGPTITRLKESLFAENALAQRASRGSMPRADTGEFDDNHDDLLHLAAQKPRPPGPGGSDSITRGI